MMQIAAKWLTTIAMRAEGGVVVSP
jgi:hypothetical protein